MYTYTNWVSFSKSLFSNSVWGPFLLCSTFTFVLLIFKCFSPPAFCGKNIQRKAFLVFIWEIGNQERAESSVTPGGGEKVYRGNHLGRIPGSNFPIFGWGYSARLKLCWFYNWLLPLWESWCVKVLQVEGVFSF